MTPGDGSLDETLLPEKVKGDPALSDTAYEPSTLREGRETDGARSAVAGYALGAVIGRGGMGEVVLAHDQDIGRDVAIKRMRAAAPTADAVQRFLREAKIQARLDHPAIVPVHDLGKDAAGLPYFAMKRLAGVTLAEVLDQDSATPQKLLRAFIDVCLAVDFAHARGVVHRDLKPANVIVGDYGEVYVLDWGVARVLADKDTNAEHDIPSLDGEGGAATVQGSLLGTPGYMSPEQARGDEVGTATDVYALGSILFEILTRTSLHPRGAAAIASTVMERDVSPAKRHPERQIAPELDAACTAALAFAPETRPTARALAEGLQRYLDGDRDLERRRALAADALAQARVALDSDDPDGRALAVQLAGRALALDPESRDASSLVSQLMLKPPVELPPSLERQLQDTEVEMARRQGKLGALTTLTYLTFIPLVLWAGVRDWTMMVIAVAVVLGIAGTAWWYATRPTLRVGWVIVANAALVIVFSRFTGSFVIVPGLAAALVMSLISIPQILTRPILLITTFIGAISLPPLLELAGWIPTTWTLDRGTLVSAPTAMTLDGLPALVFLFSATAALVLVSGMFAYFLAASRREAHRRLEIHAWHLAQLLPPETTRPATLPDPRCVI